MTQAFRDPLYRRHRFPAEVIAHAVWHYFRFPLSLRMVEDMLAARGIIVSQRWCTDQISTVSGNWCRDQISTFCIYAAGIENSLIDFGCRTNITPPAAITSAK
jgi:putative transposase